jgi:addiction module HigA family antidote
LLIRPRSFETLCPIHSALFAEWVGFLEPQSVLLIGRNDRPRMHNPPHPGKVLREFLGDIDVTAAAKHLQVSRATLSRVLNGKAGISADISLRLSAALGTHAEIWYELQTDYDLGQASQKPQPKIKPFSRAA